MDPGLEKNRRLALEGPVQVDAPEIESAAMGGSSSPIVAPWDLLQLDQPLAEELVQNRPRLLLLRDDDLSDLGLLNVRVL